MNSKQRRTDKRLLNSLHEKLSLLDEMTDIRSHINKLIKIVAKRSALKGKRKH